MGLADRYLPYYTVEERNKWVGDWELVEGIPYALASPSVEHQKVVSNLVFFLKSEFDKCELECLVLPDIDYYVSEDTVVRPDVSVVCEDIKDKLTVPPKIIFEVVSPSSVKIDEHLKFELYQREGVEYYVLVYPYKDRRHIKVFHLEEHSYKKVFETVNGVYSFKLKECNIELNFSKIWD